MVEALINVAKPRELTGLVQELLGKWAKLLAYLGLLIYLIGALTA